MEYTAAWTRTIDDGVDRNPETKYLVWLSYTLHGVLVKVMYLGIAKFVRWTPLANWKNICNYKVSKKTKSTGFTKKNPQLLF